MIKDLLVTVLGFILVIFTTIYLMKVVFTIFIFFAFCIVFLVGVVALIYGLGGLIGGKS